MLSRRDALPETRRELNLKANHRNDFVVYSIGIDLFQAARCPRVDRRPEFLKGIPSDDTQGETERPSSST